MRFFGVFYWQDPTAGYTVGTKKEDTMNTDDNNTIATYTNNTADLKSYTHKPSFDDAVCSCPRCNVHAFSTLDADAVFGFRKMKRGTRPDGSVIIEPRVQSHCRDCRREERKAKAIAKKAAAKK